MAIRVLLPGFPGKADRGFLGWCNVLVVTDTSGVMLIDTGSYGDRQMLLAALAQEGIDPIRVTTLLLTHLHFDHCLNADLFPAAEVIIGAQEWDYVHSHLPAERRDVFVPHWFLPYLDKRRKRLVREGDTVGAAGEIVELPGHTPGCIGVLLAREELLIAGDAVKNARDFYFRDPGMCFDSQEHGQASIRKAARLARHIWPGHDSMFTVDNGEIEKPVQPRVTITAFTAWRKRDGQRIILGEEEND